MSNEFIVKLRHFDKLNMFNLFRLCRKDEISFDIVAKNGNNVEATFNIVERIVQLVAFDIVAWTSLLIENYVLKVEPTGMRGRMTTRLGQNVIEAYCKNLQHL